MVAFYKHDIPAWMDGTEQLSDGAYRLYHVVCQLIYLNEGSITLNEHGIAGRCRQSIRTFRANLKELTDAGKLEVIGHKIDGSLTGTSVWSRLPIHPSIRAEVLGAAKCLYCDDAIGPFEVDHFVPLARGGTDHRSNLVCACRSCNRSKGPKLVEEWV